MDQSPSSEANGCLDDQEFPHIFMKFHYRIHDSPPLYSIHTQKNRVHNPTICFLKSTLYEGRLKGSWTGGSAPLLCIGRR